MLRNTIILAIATTIMSGAVLAQPNVLVNGDFETNPPTQLGNNIGHSIAPWVLGSGDQSNVVKVDGPGGFAYGNSGPESDASAPGAGIAQHYLDIADGSNDFYQSFTPECSGDVDFGGFFSTRADSPGTATVTIRQGVGTAGPVVGATNPINLPGGTSSTNPWTPVSFTVPVTAGTTYSFVVAMDNNMNFDNGFVRYRIDCNPAQGQLKVCKVAGPGVEVGTPFTFTAGSAPSFTVPAGPAPGGYCVVGPAFPQGSTVTVSETVPAGVKVSDITVAPDPRLVSTPNLAGGSVDVAIGSGVTEVTFTDARTGFIEICKRKTWKGGPSTFTFVVNPGNLGPFTVPAGACSPAIEVPAGTVTITEALFAGGHLTGCSTLPASMQGPCALGPQISTVTVAPGGISNQTIVFMTNGPVHDLPNEVNGTSSTENPQQ